MNTLEYIIWYVTLTVLTKGFRGGLHTESMANHEDLTEVKIGNVLQAQKGTPTGGRERRERQSPGQPKREV